MSWVCTNCSTSNVDSEDCCMVCGVSRPGKTKCSAEGEVAISAFDAWKKSIKDFFAKFSFKKTKKDEPSIPETGETAKPEKVKKTTTDSAFATPWPEHRVEFDVAVIQSKGFVKSERETLSSVNGYRFYKLDGNSQFIRVEMLITLKMARKL